MVALYGVYEQKIAINNIGSNQPDGRQRIKDDYLAFQANLGILVEPRKCIGK